ncbi:hypothetical protein MC885_015243 [Smutsia gigantea]|nr:hypothetical protein MC885_015243 [Smutsia gigantea]
MPEAIWVQLIVNFQDKILLLQRKKLGGSVCTGSHPIVLRRSSRHSGPAPQLGAAAVAENMMEGSEHRGAGLCPRLAFRGVTLSNRNRAEEPLEADCWSGLTTEPQPARPVPVGQAVDSRHCVNGALGALQGASGNVLACHMLLKVTGKGPAYHGNCDLFRGRPNSLESEWNLSEEVSEGG